MSQINAIVNFNLATKWGNNEPTFLIIKEVCDLLVLENPFVTICHFPIILGIQLKNYDFTVLNVFRLCAHT